MANGNARVVRLAKINTHVLNYLYLNMGIQLKGGQYATQKHQEFRIAESNSGQNTVIINNKNVK